MELPTTLTLTQAEEELLREALRIERLYFETLARAALANPIEFANYRARVDVINELLKRLEVGTPTLAVDPTTDSRAAPAAAVMGTAIRGN
jgi:hypothetical protein